MSNNERLTAKGMINAAIANDILNDFLVPVWSTVGVP
jgi:hypothetical protein